MRCCYCKENEAVETYKSTKDGTVAHYCMRCYARLFLSAKDVAQTGDGSCCPYCGMTLAEYQARGVVGCASCYSALYAGIFSDLLQMQGERAHVGKTPPLLQNDEQIVEANLYAAEYEKDLYRQAAMKQARRERQCAELEFLSERLRSRKDIEGAEGYEAKLSQLRDGSEVEEEFVWRTRPNLSKQR